MTHAPAFRHPTPFPETLARIRAAGEASHLTGFAGNRLDRQSEHRSETSVADALADPAARLYLLGNDRALVRIDGAAPDPHFAADAAAAHGARLEEAVLLGFDADGPRLAAPIDPDREQPEPVKAIDLRSLATQGLLLAEQLGAVAQARSMLAWHENHRFCARCGGPTNMVGGGVRRDCPACERQHFPRIDPVVIMVAISGDDCLLGRSPHFAPGMYSALAGFVEPGETIEDAVRRETAEESGIAIGAVAYHASQPWPFVSSLMIGCHAEALHRDIDRDTQELEDCRWFPRAEVRQMIAGSHPDGLKVPPEMAIAHRLVAAFVEAG